MRELRRQFQFESNVLDGRLVGCTPQYADANRLKIARGRFISDAENMQRENSCVLASKVADRLFPVQDPIGKRLYMPESKDFYIVVGVLEPKMRQLRSVVRLLPKTFRLTFTFRCKRFSNALVIW